MDERNYEEEAKLQGWNPNYDGPNKTDAKTFVEKGEKITGIMKARLDRQDREIAELRKSNKDFGEYQAKLRESDKKKAEARILELETQRAQAVNDGDGQQFTMLEREIQRERESIPTPPPPENGGMSPDDMAWAQNNQWYNTDPQLTAYADGVSGMVEAEGYQGKARLDEIARRTRETFPDKFENPNKGKSNSVEQGGEIETGDKKAHSYENLPEEDRAHCDRFIASGHTTKESFLANYEWD